MELDEKSAAVAKLEGLDNSFGADGGDFKRTSRLKLHGLMMPAVNLKRSRASNRFFKEAVGRFPLINDVVVVRVGSRRFCFYGNVLDHLVTGSDARDLMTATDAEEKAFFGTNPTLNQLDFKAVASFVKAASVGHGVAIGGGGDVVSAHCDEARELPIQGAINFLARLGLEALGRPQQKNEVLRLRELGQKACGACRTRLVITGIVGDKEHFIPALGKLPVIPFSGAERVADLGADLGLRVKKGAVTFDSLSGGFVIMSGKEKGGVIRTGLPDKEMHSCPRL